MNTDTKEQLLKDIEDRQAHLTAWEKDFIRNISPLKQLSAKQRERLEIIWERLTDKISFVRRPR